MMLTHTNALWRIDYQGDLTKAKADTLPLGFVLEARWSSEVCWLGMLFRRRLSPLEMDYVNLETWPEMRDLESFMKGLFDRVWSTNTGDPLKLGSDEIASEYSVQSSLHFAADKASVTLSDVDPEKSFEELYRRLIGLHSRLLPVVKAPVVQLAPKQKVAPAARADVEQFLRAA